MKLQRILFAWGGAVLLTALGAAPGLADEKADALLQEVAKATQATQTLTADLSLSQSGQAQKYEGKVRLKRPNLARITFGAPLNQTIASDGKTLWTLTAENQYTKQATDPKGRNINGLWAIPVSLFFDPGSLGPLGPVSATKRQYAGNETVAGQTFQVVEVSGNQPVTYTMKLYVSANKLITRAEIAIKQDKETAKLNAILTNVRTNQPLATASFAYTPPKTAKLYEEPDYESKLVPVGKEAPKFSLPTATGSHVELAEALKGKKAVLVNFWFHG